jgi:hypothetical protein
MADVPRDGRQSETALRVQRGASRLLREAGFAVLPEFTLASGRRADLAALGAKGEVWIVEIKSSLQDFFSDGKWHEYWEFCDRLYFACAPEMDAAILPTEAGLIVADHWGGEIIRHPAEAPLNAARRKSVALAFARAAALRLHSLHDPQGPG